MATAPKPRRQALDRGRWIAEALNLLASGGVAAVNVEGLAKSLRVTKGSFYWHFTDRNELLDSMLAEWRRSTTTAIVASLLSKRVTPRERLQQLWRICLSGRIDNPGGALEVALRQWGLSDAKVSALLAAVDIERTEFVAVIYGEMGAPDPEALSRLWYYYVVGCNSSGDHAAAVAAIQDVTVARILMMDAP